MKECDNCAYGGWLNGKDAITEICTKCRYICGEPTKWKAKPTTNADRIRAMSDEELADYLVSVERRRRGDGGGAIWGLPYVALEWLKQPAEGE